MTVETLSRLTGEQKKLAEYRLGESIEEIPAGALDDCISTLDGAKGDLDALGERLDRIVEKYDENEPRMEKESAIAVHTELDITRRHASHPGLWHWLCIVHYPEYIRHRFPIGGALEEKFVGRCGSDIYSNGLHRLWWFAELTREGNDYSRTELMLSEGNQYIVERIVDRSFARCEAATKAAVDLLIELDGETAEAAAYEFRSRETDYRIETMSVSDIKDVFRAILHDLDD